MISLVYFRPMTQKFGIWDQLRVDGGKEFVLISHSQEVFQTYRNNKDRLPFKATKSTEVSYFDFFKQR